MKFYSETLKKFYNTADECSQAEHEYAVREEEARLAEEKKQEERATRAKEVEDAETEMNKAIEHYSVVLSNFLNDYGAYHTTYRRGNRDMLDAIINAIDFLR